MSHVDSDLEPLWSIVLAGGEGLRLRRLIRRIYGEERPKQFAALTSEYSLLRETLDRTALLASCETTVIVVKAEHTHYLLEDVNGRRMSHVLEQPSDRGTAAGILLPAYWVRARNPEAIVAVFPSDHLVAEAGRFMAHVAEVAAAVRANPGWAVLLGTRADRAEGECGWIEQGSARGRTSAGAISAVTRFRERPGPAEAGALLAEGWLWNTCVIVAKAARLIDLGGRYVPELSALLAPLERFFGTERERWALGQAYALAPRASFARDVLQPGGADFMVSRMPTITWSDLGTPRRVFRAVRELDLRPPWLRAFRAARAPSPRRS